MGDSQSPETDKQNNASFSLEEREVKLAIGETVKLPSMRIERMRLFHGSTVSGISQFKEAEETTIGNGLYLTSQEDAALGYAFVRANEREIDTPPVVYDAEIANMNILTLTTRTAIMDFMKYIRQEFFLYNRDIVPNMPELSDNAKRWNKRALDAKNDLLWEAIQAGRVLSPKIFLFGAGAVAREILMREGYDGLMAIEGGEHGKNPFTNEHFSIGDHDSYVIFQPEKVKILKETPRTT